MSGIVETAKCSGCGLLLRGKPYRFGGRAYHPLTGEWCPPNHYGGYVCSPLCDIRVSLEVERSMPGHFGQVELNKNSEAWRDIIRHWSNR